uniref:hypothetical protein n=1 Tax=Tistrella bauzanensis TaxID=657419 RepID=UPI0038D4CD66
RRSAVAHHVHRHAIMGTWVTVHGTWYQSLPVRERELKRGPCLGGRGQRPSLPVRERELKLEAPDQAPMPIIESVSLPVRERELKQPVAEQRPDAVGRSPCGSVN